MIPTKKSNTWIGIFIVYTIVIFIGLLATRIILGSEIVGRYLFGLIIISMGSALVPCLGGYLGKRIFFIIYTLSVIIGILYMFYVVLGNTAPGWGDLTSMIGYLFIIGIGAIFAFVTEVVAYFVHVNKIKGPKNNKF